MTDTTEFLRQRVEVQAPQIRARCSRCGWTSITRIRQAATFELACGYCNLPFTIAVIGGLPDEPLPAASDAPVTGRGDHGDLTPAAAAEAELGHSGEPSAATSQGHQEPHLVTPRRFVDLADPELRMPLERWAKYDANIRSLWSLLPVSHGTGRAVACAARCCGWDGRRQTDWAEQPPVYTRAVITASIELVLRRRGIAIPATGGESLEPAEPQMPEPQLPVVVTEPDHGHDQEHIAAIDQRQPGQDSLLDLLRQGLAEEKGNATQHQHHYQGDR